MFRILSKRYLFLLMALSWLPVSGQDISFSQLTRKDGLSHYSVLALYQDENGFIWMGTREGLNVYDGTSVRVFKVEKVSENAINSNYIKGVTGNNQGKLYIWNTVGIVEYNMYEEIFTPLYKGDVSSMFYGEKLYVAEGNQLLVLNDSTRHFEPCFEFEDENIVIQSILPYENGLLLGTNSNGLVSISGDSIRNILISNVSVISIYQGLNGSLWVGTANNGLYCIEQNRLTNYRHNSAQNSVCSNYIRTICEDNNGNIWIGTFNGLSRFNRVTETFTNYFSEREPGSMSGNSIWSLLKDHQGSIWFGTYYGGVNYFNPEYEIFTIFRKSENETSGPNTNIIGRSLEDKNRNLWICTDGGGINKYDPAKNTFKWYQHKKNKNSVSHNNIKTLFYDNKQDEMWFGTHLGGLNRLDLKTEKFTNYTHVPGDSLSLPSDIIYDIEAYNEILILATKSGVAFFNKTSGKCERIIKSKFINVVVDIQIDNLGILWMSIDNGLASYDLKTGELKVFMNNDSLSGSLSNNSVNRIYQDSWNQLWICTLGGGLDLYCYEDDSFTNFDVSNSDIQSNTIYYIEEYAPGKLLISTDKGLSLFDSKSSDFVNYEFDRDLPISNINNNAIYINESGGVYIGTTKGLISFNIQDLAFKKKQFSIFPYLLYINGSQVKPLDDNEILSKSLQYTPKIKLKSSHKTFEIKVAVTNYISANKPEIRHKLVGFDQEWVPTKEQNIINYFNLNPGDYQLIIEAVINSEVITRSSLDIVIQPPFYRTTVAYLIYFILVGFVTYLVFKAKASKIRLEESLKYERKHLTDIQELNQNKLQFFSNISHELLTPLTLIIGQLEVLVTSHTFVPKVYNKIISTYRNSKQMQALISDLLDFRKQDSGKMQINVLEADITNHVQEAYLHFNQYAETRKIEFNLHLPEVPMIMWFDPKQILKVLNNLLSNAFKHTQKGDRIEISLENTVDGIILKVMDTGSGIDENELGKIFDRFYQGKGSNGTGIGLALAKGIVELHGGTIDVESKKGQGTCFIVELPKGKEHFLDSQIIDERDVVVDSNELEEIKIGMTSDAVDAEFTNNGIPHPELKIMIIEDNEAIRDMLCDIFKGIYQVVSAKNGEIGLQMVEKENPSIILSDIVMPKVSGIELCKRIKSNIETSHIPVVLLTARNTSEQYIEGLKYGADDYITKPFNANILVSRCNNLVKSRMVLQEKYSKQQQASPKVLATNELDNYFLDNCIHLIEKYLDDPKFNVQLFSQEMGMARTNLFNKIKAITGQTPNEFLISFRLKKAAFMLKNNLELSVADISVLTGFGSSRYFSKTFKDKYHCTPLAYRND